MNVHVIKVWINALDKLVVAPSFCEIEMDNRKPSLIVWVLLDGGTDARFVLPGDGNGDGFQWSDGLTLAYFMNLRISTDGKFMSVEDHHASTSTVIERLYKLRVKRSGVIYDAQSYEVGTEGGEPCQSIFSGRNPVIINR